MPNASAPSAPWVEVWQSPHTIIMPGWVRPCSGPTTCTMPCRAVVQAEQRDAGRRGVRVQVLDHAAAVRVGDRREIAAARRHVVVRASRRCDPAAARRGPSP